METGLTKNAIISQLTKSPHGKLDEYVSVGGEAAQKDAEFFAHLIAWNQRNGQIRDAKVALPVLALKGTVDPEFIDNALAHLAALDPRNFLRAAMWAKAQGAKVRQVRSLVERFLRAREEKWSWWERSAVQHRASMKELYRYFHVKPSAQADLILFKGEKPKGTVFEAISMLPKMAPKEAAGTILELKIPFLIAAGALKEKIKDPDLLMALIDRMSPTELVTNAKRLEKLGVKNTPALRAAFEQALVRTAGSKANMLKTAVAAEAVEDETIKAKLSAIQEKQIDNAKGIEGNWLVLGDKSGSMAKCIEASRHIAATLARMVKGTVSLIFFDTSPRYIDATGKTYEQLVEETKRIEADGGTSIGCGVQYAMEKPLDIDGIAVVTDCAENRAPLFQDRYKAYCEQFGKEPPIYIYRFSSNQPFFQDRDLAKSLADAGVDYQEFDADGVDYYSLPNLVSTMRANRFGLLDEIMATPLLKLDKVLPLRQEELQNA